MNLTLTVKEAARELAVAPLAVLRLIALAILPGVKLADGWRIDPDALRTYLNRGATRLPMPDVERRGWFEDYHIRGTANAFVDVVRSTMDAAFYAEPPARLFPRGTMSAIVDIKPTAALRQQASRSAPDDVNIVTDGGESVTWQDAFLVDRLRQAAFDLVKAPKLGSTPLDRLYATPEEFDRIVAQASAAVLQQSISRDVVYVLDGRNVTIRYRLSLGELLPGSDLARIQRLAF